MASLAKKKEEKSACVILMNDPRQNAHYRQVYKQVGEGLD